MGLLIPLRTTKLISSCWKTIENHSQDGVKYDGFRVPWRDTEEFAKMTNSINEHQQKVGMWN
jgi:hypothetical protein